VRQIWLERGKAAIRWVVVAATALVLFRVGSTHSNELRAIDLDFNIFWLANAAIATTAANLLLPLGWRQIVISFNQRLLVGPAVRVWCLAQTARYLPTGLVAVASRLQLAAKAGISRSITATSIVIETAVLLGWALLVCAMFVPSTTLPQSIRWLIGVSCVLGLVTSPWLITFIGLRVSRIKKWSAIKPRSGLVAHGVALLGTSVAARAIGTTCLAAGFLGITSEDITLIVGATYAGVAAGMIGVTPAGLGVREGVMAAILAHRFGLSDAAAFALLSRAWEFAFEMLFLAVASWWGRKSRPLNNSGEGSPISDAKL
jgi:uncharacterized membrane protein YbhN (UPF0104 family)